VRTVDVPGRGDRQVRLAQGARPALAAGAREGPAAPRSPAHRDRVPALT
jgi:hypothetical protein